MWMPSEQDFFPIAAVSQHLEHVLAHYIFCTFCTLYTLYIHIQMNQINSGTLYIYIYIWMNQIKNKFGLIKLCAFILYWTSGTLFLLMVVYFRFQSSDNPMINFKVCWSILGNIGFNGSITLWEVIYICSKCIKELIYVRRSWHGLSVIISFSTVFPWL